MASSCYSGSSRTEKPGLDPTRISLLEGILFGINKKYICMFISIDCVKKIFGDAASMEHATAIKRKCTQKCLDKARKGKKWFITL